jgi:hypothetical protein
MSTVNFSLISRCYKNRTTYDLQPIVHICQIDSTVEYTSRVQALLVPTLLTVNGAYNKSRILLGQIVRFTNLAVSS